MFTTTSRYVKRLDVSTLQSWIRTIVVLIPLNKMLRLFIFFILVTNFLICYFDFFLLFCLNHHIKVFWFFFEIWNSCSKHLQCEMVSPCYSIYYILFRHLIHFFHICPEMPFLKVKKYLDRLQIFYIFYWKFSFFFKKKFSNLFFFIFDAASFTI